MTNLGSSLSVAKASKAHSSIEALALMANVPTYYVDYYKRVDRERGRERVCRNFSEW